MMDRSIVEMIQAGDVGGLERGLAAAPGRAASRPDGQRTLLHVATDWPGHFPNVRETIGVLVAAGADVNARVVGMRHRETPLHWAASADDVTALDALLDAGADMEADGAVIGGGTALADAVAFANWASARRLVERGAKTTVWQAAALGLMDRLGEIEPGDATNALWNACHGGQTESARWLLSRGAELNWRGHDGLTPLGAARRGGHDELVTWLESVGAID